MKKYLLAVAIILFVNNIGYGQATLLHRFSKPRWTESQIINLSRSGKKIMTVYQPPVGPDTVFFYNMDYSYWKQIICPFIPGYSGQFNFFKQVGITLGIYYPSETLFNTDTLLEMAVLYSDDTSSPSNGKFLIINENGSVVDSMLDVNVSFSENFKVFSDSSGVFKLTVPTRYGIDVYRLPGTLPCETCLYTSFVANQNERPNTIITEPVPNPSRDNVKITFTLPEGVNRGELQLFSNNGVRIKTCQVDNHFGFIMLDNSLLTPGLYYYNIVVNGAVSSTQKLLVVK